MSSRALPGEDLITQGLGDLGNRVPTIASLLVSIAAPRLRSLGYVVPIGFPEPELHLYRMLAIEFGDGAHGKYNALIRRIVSFQRAAACAT